MADGIYSLSPQHIAALYKTLLDKSSVHPSCSHAAGLLPQQGITSTISPESHDHLPELHVVMVPYPLQGHINPMMQFAKVLTAKHSDIRVTFVNNKHNHDRLVRPCTYSCTSLTPSSPSPDICMQQAHPHQASKLQFSWVDNGLPPDFDYTDLNRTKTSMHEFHGATYNMKDPLKQLLQSLNKKKSSPVSCVLAGCFCPWAHAVATELGIPSVLFWTQSTSVFSMYCHAPLLAANGFFPYNRKALPGCNEDEIKPHKTTEKVSYIPGVPPLHPSNFPTLLHIDSMSDPDFKSIKEQFDILHDYAGVIVNSFEELEKNAYQELQSEVPCPISLVGPLIPAAFLEGDDMTNTSIRAGLFQEKNECIQWLDRQQNKSVLYVSFGTVFNPSNEDLKSIACGIRAIKQPFLWVIRHRSSVPNVADILPKDFTQDTKEYGLIIPWAPQMQVLSHPSVGAFLTHSGWNSTLESMSMGMPMIPFPLMSDQPTNCSFVCDVWKIGMALQRQDDGKVKSADVETVVRTVLQEQEGKEMRKRAGKLREAARRAMLPEGPSSIQVEKFIEAMRNQSVRMALT